MSVTKQERFEPLPHPTLVVHGIFACANQIADGFVLRFGNHNRYKVPSTVKSGKRQGVATVSLDPHHVLSGALTKAGLQSAKR